MGWKTASTICVVTGSLLLAAGHSPWQTKKGPARPAPKAAPKDDDSGGVEISTPDLPPLAPFPTAWPSPLAKPSGSPEVVASALAKKVVAGGPETLPALQRAALESGFSIHKGEDGSILFSPTSDADSGMSIADFDLYVAAEGAKRKTVQTYASLQEELGEDSAGLPLAELLSQSVTEGLFSKNAAHRFWGNFIWQLAAQSEGEVDAIGLSGETTLSAPQACFLLYMAAAQAWAATEDTPQSGEAVDPTTPPAEEPPRHGPNAQAQQRDAAFRNLRQAINNYSESHIAEFIRQQAAQGRNAHDSFLGLARKEILAVGTKIRIRMGSSPLVRNRFYGQTGGTRPIYVSVNFDVSNDLRSRYDALRRFVRNGRALPENGPQDVTVRLMPEGDAPITVKQEIVRTNGDEARTDIVGKAQEKRLPSTPLTDDYTKKLFALTPAAQPKASRVLQVPIRDWLDSGVKLMIRIKVTGSGTIHYPEDVTLLWLIDRKIIDTTVLDEPVAMAMMTPANFDPTKMDRFTTYMKNPDTSKAATDPDPAYHVDDLYVWEGPAKGCGVKPGARYRSVKTVISRPWHLPPQATVYTRGMVQRDASKDLYSFTMAFRPVPVTISFSGSPDQEDEMSVLKDIALTAGSAGPNKLERDSISQFDRHPNQGLVPGTAKVESLAGGSGQDTVTVEVDWFIDRPGANANAGKKGPLTLAETKAVESRVQQLLANVLAPFEAQSRNSSSLAEEQSLGRGPLWISDASAATCSEVQIADALPRGLIATK